MGIWSGYLVQPQKFLYKNSLVSSLREVLMFCHKSSIIMAALPKLHPSKKMASLLWLKIDSIRFWTSIGIDVLKNGSAGILQPPSQIL